MKTPTSSGFTLIELLIVIVIIAVLAGIVLPIYGNIQLAGKRVQSLSNMRQLGTAFISYCNDNNGVLPTQGDSNPTWAGAAATTSTETTAWYNALPRAYANSKGMGDFVNDRPDFYAKGSLFYVPAATYPSTKLNAPLCAVAMCSKLYDSSLISDSDTVRLQNFQAPAETCIFQESGLSGEKPIYSNQSSYTGQASSFASRAVARYDGKTIIVFADGHADSLNGSDIVDSKTGKAFYPQVASPGTATQTGKIYWTLAANANANN